MVSLMHFQRHRKLSSKSEPDCIPSSVQANGTAAALTLLGHPEQQGQDKGMENKELGLTLCSDIFNYKLKSVLHVMEIAQRYDLPKIT